ncbi:15886_t:CDS:2, partial [Entrophospora sp. SA101]
FFQEIADEVPKTFALLEKEDERKIPEDDDKLREFKKNNEQLKNFIQQERKKRGLATPTNKPTNNQPNPPQNSQQVQNPQKEINDLNQKVAELQNQIKELLAKQEKEPLDQNTKQEIQQKQQPTNTSQPKNEFNWLYVVIPGARRREKDEQEARRQELEERKLEQARKQQELAEKVYDLETEIGIDRLVFQDQRKEKIAAAKSAGITEELEEAEANLIITVAEEVLHKFAKEAKEEDIPPEH